jgi:PAS domain S-box-containing protein
MTVSWVTIIWSMIGSACGTLAGIYFLVWCRDRTSWTSLLFSLTAVGAAGWDFCELGMMLAQTPADFGTALRWAQVFAWLWTFSVVGFVWVYMQAGRLWLAWLVSGLRTFSLLPNFLAGPNLNYRSITALRHVPFLGQSIAIAEAVPSHWMLFGQVSLGLLILFICDASLAAWRRGERRKALAVGGTCVFFVLVALLEAVFIFWRHAQVPLTVSFAYMGLVVVMAYELGRDVLRASQLAIELNASQAGVRENEHRMSLAVEAAKFGIWIWSVAHNEIWASAKWRELFGFRQSDELKIEDLLQRVNYDDRETVQKTLDRVLEAGGSYDIEYRVVLPDGGMRWIASHGQVEFGTSGEAVLIRGASRDVTERKLAEHEMLLLRQEIAHVSRVSMLGQLASSLAHEINQPIAAILRNAEAAEILMEAPSPDLDEIRAIIGDIRKDDERAANVIDRMRGFLKRQSLNAGALDMGDLIGETRSLVRADALARQVKLDVDVPPELPRVHGDRVHVQQVLLNLIVNGMDALDKTHPKSKLVTVSALYGGERTVEISVSDTGSGIPADKFEHIFTPFFTTKPNGMGMGLPISRTIIEAHGGKFWVENNRLGGATFHFTLPIAEAATQ